MPSLLADNLEYLDRDKYQNQGLATLTPQDYWNFIKGRGVGLLTAAPDLLGMAAQGYSHIPGPGMAPLDKPPISGDPIREVTGTNNRAGLLGEMFDPMNRISKVAKAASGLLQNAPEIGKAMGEGGLLAQALFHGTPHKFDKFDLKAIGTGEGAQAYGHGLYFAESPGVAGSYKNKLSGVAGQWKATPRGKPAEWWNQAKELYPDDKAKQEAWHAINQWNKWDEGPDAAKKWHKKMGYSPESRAVTDEVIDEIYSPGHLYEVDLPDETIAKMLDWDAPLSEQPFIIKAPKEEIIAKVKAEGRSPTLVEQVSVNLQNPNSAENTMGWTGHQWYKNVAQKAGGEEAASKALNEAGIPGIRFYDGSSRFVKKIKTYDTKGNLIGEAIGKTDADVERIIAKHKKGKTYGKSEVTSVPESERTRNIVVFNPDDIASVKRDGELVYDTGKKGGLLGTGVADDSKTALRKLTVPEFMLNKARNPSNPRQYVIGDAFVGLRKTGDGWHLDSLQSTKKGSGKKAMEAISREADKEGITITLEAVPFDSEDLSKAELREYYSGFGFKRTSGDNMVRKPSNVPDKVEWQDTTTIPNYDEAKANPKYWREKKNTVVAERVMSPDEYLQYVDEGFSPQHISGTEYADPIDRELVEQYAKEMMSGDKFPRLSLDYKGGFTQEGRHRALAAKAAGIDEVPVEVMYAADGIEPHAVRTTDDIRKVKPTTTPTSGGLLGTRVADDFVTEVKSVKGEPVRAVNEARANTKSNPVTVYHSTGEDFTEFDPSKGIGGQMWFTSKKDLAEAGYDGAASRGRLVEASIDIRNPAGWDEYDKYGIDELMGQGYDGLKLESGDEVTYAAFFPEQVSVKSNSVLEQSTEAGLLGKRKK